jgi:nucleotide-binding universal stress UspA family protein
MNAPDSRPVLCGTDFSEGAARAADAAAAMARRLGVPLLLVHSVDERAEFPVQLHARFVEERRPQLAQEAERVRALGATVEERVLGGRPGDGIVECAVKAHARLIVAAASATGALGRWTIGSVAERTAESAPVPTLVVRAGEPFEQWARGERTLRIVVGVDFTATADAALRWIAELRAIGPCDVLAAFVDWPPEERARLGVAGALDLISNPPSVQEVLERDLREKVAAVLGPEGVRTTVQSAWGRADAAIVELAIADKADLIVVGAHQWHGLSRLRHGSVSRGILHHAPMSVACVPVAGIAPVPVSHTPQCRRVLAAVDPGATHGFAAPHAYSIVDDGGTVRLVHTIAPHRPPNPLIGGHYEDGESAKQHRERIAQAEARLRALTPPEAAVRRVATEVEVAEDLDAARAICQAAERFNADVVCIGAHTRPGMAAKVLGSVSLGVLRQCRRPVLIVWPPRA